MRSRRVPVLRWGSRGPGGDARSLRLCPPSVRKRLQAPASVRECRRESRIVGSRKSSRNAELSSLFTLSVPKVSTVTGIGWVIVAKPRTVVAFGVVLRLRVSIVSTVTGIGGVVVEKRRTVVTVGLVLRLRVSKVLTVTGIGGDHSRETQNCRHFWTRLASSRLNSVNSDRDGGGRGRETQNCRHCWTRLASSRLKSVNSHRDRGGS